MLSRKTIAALVAAAALGAGAAPAQAETLWLDTYEADDDGFVGPAVTAQPLSPTKLYFATIDGTFRYGRPGTLANPSYIWCPGSKAGVPIKYPSTDTAAVNDVAFADAESVFALRVISSRVGTCPSLPYHNTALQFGLGGAAKHLEPAGGPFKAPKADNTYSYVLQGQGSVGQFAFRIREPQTTDNAGKLRIVLRAATGEDCKKDGWREFVLPGETESMFKNQGDCVSHFATKGKNPPAGPGA
jgi:hypothetical protein